MLAVCNPMTEKWQVQIAGLRLLRGKGRGNNRAQRRSRTGFKTVRGTAWSRIWVSALWQQHERGCILVPTALGVP